MTLVEQWKHLDRQCIEHMDRFGVVSSAKPCGGCGADTCTYVLDIARQMRALWVRMTEAEREHCR
jgi:hypothetical protein